VVQKTQ